MTAPSFLTRTATALSNATSGPTASKILVAVQLSGGNDGLNTVIPFADPGYSQFRSSLAIPTSDVLQLTGLPLFVIGGSVTPGLYGSYPSLEDLDDNGDLKFGVDFRNVFATVLRNHLATDPTPVLAGTYDPVNLLRT